MNDRELLKLAAKAAGYVIEGDADRLVAQPGHFAGGFSILNDRGGSSLWNPLHDDGDALRLAVKLKLPLDFLNRQTGFCTSENKYGKELWIECGSYWDSCHSMYYPFSEKYEGDPYAATRRAIVRAAAEIGKEMK